VNQANPHLLLNWPSWSAVEALEDLLADTKHPAVRLGAARTVVEVAMHQHDADTIILRPEKIEAAQEKRGGK